MVSELIDLVQAVLDKVSTTLDGSTSCVAYLKVLLLMMMMMMIRSHVGLKANPTGKTRRFVGKRVACDPGARLGLEFSHVILAQSSSKFAHV